MIIAIVFNFFFFQSPKIVSNNCVELIELGEVFALEKFPSKFEATHKLQRWQIFRAGKNLGEKRRGFDAPSIATALILQPVPQFTTNKY